MRKNRDLGGNRSTDLERLVEAWRRLLAPAVEGQRRLDAVTAPYNHWYQAFLEHIRPRAESVVDSYRGLERFGAFVDAVKYLPPPNVPPPSGVLPPASPAGRPPRRKIGF